VAQGALFWNDDKSRAYRPRLSIHPFVRIDAWSIVPPRITISTEICRDAFDSTNPNVLVSASPPAAVLDMLRIEIGRAGRTNVDQNITGRARHHSSRNLGMHSTTTSRPFRPLQR